MAAPLTDRVVCPCAYSASSGSCVPSPSPRLPYWRHPCAYSASSVSCHDLTAPLTASRSRSRWSPPTTTVCSPWWKRPRSTLARWWGRRTTSTGTTSTTSTPSNWVLLSHVHNANKNWLQGLSVDSQHRRSPVRHKSAHISHPLTLFALCRL